MMTDFDKNDLRSAIKPLGGISHLVMLDLPSVMPHHRERPLFFADENEDFEVILENMVEKGYFDPLYCAEVLRRPVWAYHEKDKLVYGVAGDGGISTLISLKISELLDLSQNFFCQEAEGDFKGVARIYPLFAGADTYKALSLGVEGWRLGVPQTVLDDPELCAKVEECLSHDDPRSHLSKLSVECKIPLILLGTDTKRVAFLSAQEEGRFLPLRYTEVLDMVAFFS